MMEDEALSSEVCQKIIDLAKDGWNQAQTIGSLDDVRKSDIIWVNEQWIYELIYPYMTSANVQAGWNYNVISVEDCQITRYTEDGFYSWHKDGIGSHNEVWNKPEWPALHGNTRKLSMTIVLNSDFEGGEFEIYGLNDETKVPRLEKGSIIVFPSFMDHRVTPVTKGTRYSLVAWFVGPPFV